MPPHHLVLRGPALIRAATDADASAIIALIWRCWSGYPGTVMDVEGEEPNLRAPASYYLHRGGRLWVTPDVSGMAATRPRTGAEWEICRMYVHPDRHGTGLGHALLDVAEAHAAGQGAVRLVLWTDKRFERAHRFYEKRGYRRFGQPRALHDKSGTVEYCYVRPVP